MVKQSLILSAATLAGLASALYVPHEGVVTVYSDPKQAKLQAQKLAAEAIHRGKELRHAGHGCRGRFSDPSKWKVSGAAIPNRADSHHRNNEASESSNSKVVSFAASDKVIEGSYIVVLKSDAPDSALASLLELLMAKSGVSGTVNLDASVDSVPQTDNFSLKWLYNLSKSFRGYAGKFPAEVAELLAEHPDVAHVEKDSIVHALNTTEEDEAPWGLARVSHRKPLGLSTYNKYLYDGEGGEGVTAYIVDTGIYIDHEDFEGRAKWGKTMPAGDEDVDAHGHGSHCAGTIGGKQYGLAKKAKLVAVKVLGSDGSGSMSDVIGGVEYVVESHRKEQKEGGADHKGSTANMSLGGGKSPSLDIAVNAATEAGIHFAVAAGNDNQDACYYSPAASVGAVTVGATDVRDNRAYFSNYGKCVDIFAPGVNVLSVGTTSPSSSAVMSGTSMASPHIAGLLTYFLSLQPSLDSAYAVRGAITTKELKKHLINFGTHNLISGLDTESPNVLAFNGAGKDLKDFWITDESEPETEQPSFFDKVEDTIEDAYEYMAETVEDLLIGTQELVGELF